MSERKEDIEVVRIEAEQCVIQNCCNDAKRQLRLGTTRVSLCHWHGADLRDILNEGAAGVQDATLKEQNSKKEKAEL